METWKYKPIPYDSIPNTYHVQNERGEKLCEVSGSYAKERGLGGDESLRIANLVTAAPILLAALKGIVEHGANGATIIAAIAAIDLAESKELRFQNRQVPVPPGKL